MRQALRAGDFLFWVAGNHLGALPVYDELAAQPDGVLVVQFDAHLDIHHFRDMRHGAVARQFPAALRRPAAASWSTSATANCCCRPTTSAAPTTRRFRRPNWRSIRPRPWNGCAAPARTAERVFLDLDCDVFDPAYFPAVSQPVPFGLGPPLFLRLLDAVWSPKVAGVLISEFDPSRDRDDRSLALLVWLLEYLLLRRYE